MLVMAFNHLMPLFASEDCGTVSSQLPLSILHGEVLIETLRGQHQAVVFIQLNERGVNFWGFWVLQAQFSWISSSIVENSR
jgi:hypothetical protein